VAVHGRTRAQAYSGEANWDLIGEMVGAVDIPIIGNGDINSYADAKKRMSETGCAAVMIGRGALGNPWIFEHCRAGEDRIPTPEERAMVIGRHFAAHVAFHRQLFAQDPGASKNRRGTPDEQAVKTFRQHLIWYSRGLKGGSVFRGYAMTLETPEAVSDAILRFFGELRDDDVLDPGEEAEGVNYQQAFG